MFWKSSPLPLVRGPLSLGTGNWKLETSPDSRRSEGFTGETFSKRQFPFSNFQLPISVGNGPLTKDYGQRTKDLQL